MVVNGQDMGYLSKRFSKIWLIEMTRIVMEISMRNIFLVGCSPHSRLAILLAARSKPLLERWDLFPKPVGADLVAETKLAVEATTLGVLLHNVFPHVADTAESGTFIGANIDGEVVARSRDETPVAFVSACNHEFVPRATQMGCYSICPLSWPRLVHLNVNVVLVERPPLMVGDIVGFQLSRIRRQVIALVQMDCRRLRRICH
jgi:hypothetical protein